MRQIGSIWWTIEKEEGSSWKTARLRFEHKDDDDNDWQISEALFSFNGSDLSASVIKQAENACRIAVKMSPV